jgi:predicted ABC-type transport system involved in lysophospholipase L1 biosynthesis ATPase subunit
MSDPAADSAVQLLDVSKVYGTPAAPVRALDGVTLAIGRGERVALLGRSGSGKSTLLQLLGGLDRPTSGRILAAGRDLAALRTDELARYRQDEVGLVFQAFHLIPTRTALENVELPMVFAGRPPRERRAAARAALEAVGLGARLTHRPAELSGGERQRVAIARALVNRPKLLLADEPTGNLDSATAAEVMTLLLSDARARGAALVLVTHDEELARRSAERIVRLADGRVVSG